MGGDTKNNFSRKSPFLPLLQEHLLEARNEAEDTFFKLGKWVWK